VLGQVLEVIKRKLELSEITSVSLSTRQDDFVVLHTGQEPAEPIELVCKTEFLTLLDEKYKAMTQRTLQLNFSDRIEFEVRSAALAYLP